MNCAASVKTLPPKGSTDVGWSHLRMAREVTESLLLIYFIYSGFNCPLETLSLDFQINEIGRFGDSPMEN